MKYKYLMISGGGQIIWGRNNLTKEHLIMRKDGRYESIVDIQAGKEYNPDLNVWEDIKGDD